VGETVKALRGAYQLEHSVSATLSGWFALTGNGVPEFVVTSDSIDRFSHWCGFLALEPRPAQNNEGIYSNWHSARMDRTKALFFYSRGVL